MKDREMYFIAAIVIAIIGAILLAGSVSIYVPSEYKTFLGIPYDVNSQYGNAVFEKMVLFITGFVFLFLGLVIFLSSLLKTSNSQLSVSMEKKYCRYCGTENKKDATFCEKCGKRISEIES